MIKEQLQKLIEECQQIRGQWNGKDSGWEEDQARIASDIIEKAQELIALCHELNGTN